MKKLTVSFLLLMGAWSFQACNNNGSNTNNTDSTTSMTTTTNDSNNTMTDTTNHGDTANNAANANANAQPVSQQGIDFVQKAASGGMMEVQLGQMAQQKAANPRVKAFGQMMVDDHSKANDQLKSVAAQQNVQVPTTMKDSEQKKVNDLSKKSGNDFDKAYMSMMVSDHKHDIQEFQNAAKDTKDQAISNFATNTLPVLQKHLDSAQAINKALH